MKILRLADRSDEQNDPLSLLFAVQFLHVTSRLTALPHTYSRDLAGKFAWANLQLPAPVAVRRLVASWDDGCGFPRTQNSTHIPWASEPKCLFADGAADDVTEEDKEVLLLAGNVFYVLAGLGSVVALHAGVLLLLRLRWASIRTPAWGRYPLAEIVLVLAVANGAVDAATAVLCGKLAAPGWRTIGVSRQQTPRRTKTEKPD